MHVCTRRRGMDAYIEIYSDGLFHVHIQRLFELCKGIGPRGLSIRFCKEAWMCIHYKATDSFVFTYINIYTYISF